MTDENVPTLFENEDIICGRSIDAGKQDDARQRGVENLPRQKLVSASGMAGFRSSNLVSTRRVSKNFYFCGDGETAPVPGAGLMAPRVGVVACAENGIIARLMPARRRLTHCYVLRCRNQKSYCDYKRALRTTQQRRNGNTAAAQQSQQQQRKHPNEKETDDSENTITTAAADVAAAPERHA